MSKQNNIALKALILINSDRKHAIKGATVAHSGLQTKKGNVISIAGYLKRVAFHGGFAS
jgi:hypothetical protein